MVPSSTIVEKWPHPVGYHSPFTIALRNFGNDLCPFFSKFTAPSFFLLHFYVWLTKNAGASISFDEAMNFGKRRQRSLPKFLSAVVKGLW